MKASISYIATKAAPKPGGAAPSLGDPWGNSILSPFASCQTVVVEKKKSGLLEKEGAPSGSLEWLCTLLVSGGQPDSVCFCKRPVS